MMDEYKLDEIMESTDPTEMPITAFPTTLPAESLGLSNFNLQTISEANSFGGFLDTLLDSASSADCGKGKPGGEEKQEGPPQKDVQMHMQIHEDYKPDISREVPAGAAAYSQPLNQVPIASPQPLPPTLPPSASLGGLNFSSLLGSLTPAEMQELFARHGTNANMEIQGHLFGMHQGEHQSPMSDNAMLQVLNLLAPQLRVPCGSLATETSTSNEANSKGTQNTEAPPQLQRQGSGQEVLLRQNSNASELSEDPNSLLSAVRSALVGRGEDIVLGGYQTPPRRSSWGQENPNQRPRSPLAGSPQGGGSPGFPPDQESLLRSLLTQHLAAALTPPQPARDTQLAALLPLLLGGASNQVNSSLTPLLAQLVLQQQRPSTAGLQGRVSPGLSPGWEPSGQAPPPVWGSEAGGVQHFQGRQDQPTNGASAILGRRDRRRSSDSVPPAPLQRWGSFNLNLNPSPELKSLRNLKGNSDPNNLARTLSLDSSLTGRDCSIMGRLNAAKGQPGFDIHSFLDIDIHEAPNAIEKAETSHQGSPLRTNNNLLKTSKPMSSLSRTSPLPAIKTPRNLEGAPSPDHTPTKRAATNDAEGSPSFRRQKVNAATHLQPLKVPPKQLAPLQRQNSAPTPVFSAASQRTGPPMRPNGQIQQSPQGGPNLRPQPPQWGPRPGFQVTLKGPDINLGYEAIQSGPQSAPGSGLFGAAGSPVGGLGRGMRKPRASDAHSQAERVRRERINERMKELQDLCPTASKMDKVSQLEEIIDYVKFLQVQIKVLTLAAQGESDEATLELLEKFRADIGLKGGGGFDFPADIFPEEILRQRDLCLVPLAAAQVAAALQQQQPSQKVEQIEAGLKEGVKKDNNDNGQVANAQAPETSKTMGLVDPQHAPSQLKGQHIDIA